MSDGPRITLAQADAVVARLRDRWRLGENVHVCGSIRRRQEWVGDIDLIAPYVSPAAQDPLYERVVATCDNPPPRTSIFAAEVTPAQNTFCTAVSGLRPGFLEARLELKLWQGRQVIKCQISRYTPENFGWLMIEKTGPWNFGKWFLMKWKQRHGMPTGDAKYKASIDNHLVGPDQQPVTVATEEGAFIMCGIPWIAPDRREAFVRRAEAMSSSRRTA